MTRKKKRSRTIVIWYCQLLIEFHLILPLFPLPVFPLHIFISIVVCVFLFLDSKHDIQEHLWGAWYTNNDNRTFSVCVLGWREFIKVNGKINAKRASSVYQVNHRG